LDLENAIQKHAEWKFKFRTALSTLEPMDAIAIAKDNCCEFGKWLHGEARIQYGKFKSYQRCIADHAAFHIEAGKVAKAINAKKKDEAESMLASGSAYGEASKRVGISIIELINEIRKTK